MKHLYYVACFASGLMASRIQHHTHDWVLSLSASIVCYVALSLLVSLVVRK